MPLKPFLVSSSGSSSVGKCARKSIASPIPLQAFDEGQNAERANHQAKRSYPTSLEREENYQLKNHRITIEKT
jgi:hypothetical protein